MGNECCKGLWGEKSSGVHSDFKKEMKAATATGTAEPDTAPSTPSKPSKK